MATKAEALAVALDHAEETGEYPLALRKRVAALWPQLNFVVEVPSRYATHWYLKGSHTVSLTRAPQGTTEPSSWILMSLHDSREPTRWDTREAAEQWARKRFENAGYVCVLTG